MYKSFAKNSIFVFLGCVFGGEVLRFFHGGDECLTIPPTWSEQPEQKYVNKAYIFMWCGGILNV